MLSGIEAIAEVARRLGPLRERVVFLGGAATGLLITDVAAPEMRVTDDVDVIVEVASRTGYYRIEEELRRQGFSQRHEEGDPVCRWTVSGIVVDVMPTDESVLGFGNRWYVPAIEKASTVSLPQGVTVRAVTAPYFLATKLEAFGNRGRGNFLGSRDIADIVSLVDGREELVGEVAAAEPSVRAFIAGSLRAYRESEAFAEAVAGHMMPDPVSQQRVPMVLNRMDQMASMDQLTGIATPE